MPLIAIALLACFLTLPIKADKITGPGSLASYYLDAQGQNGLLNLTDGQTWTLTVTNINASQITGNKLFQFFLQDYSQGSAAHMITIQVHVDYYGSGGHLFQSYEGYVLKSSQPFSPGQVQGLFDLRVQIRDLGSNYLVTPQYRLPSGSWQTFQGGSWHSGTYELAHVYLAMQVDYYSDGTVAFDPLTAHSEETWYVDKAGKIQDAVNGAISGATVLIFGGTHPESLYINKSLTIEGVQNPVITGAGVFTINYGDTQLTRQAVIFIANSTNTVLEGLDIRGQGLGQETSAGVFFIYSVGNMINCSVSPNATGEMNTCGIEARASTLVVQESTVEHFGRTGIYFGNCTGGVYNSTVEGDVYTEYNETSCGIEVDVYRQGPSNLEIIGNEILNCSNTYLPAPSSPSIGIAVDLWRRYDDLNASTVIIENNKIHNNDEAIELVPSNNSYGHYDDIFDNGQGVIADPDYSSSNVTFDSRFNWWGESGGPSHSSNIGGTGDTISDFVDYSPWLDTPYGTTPQAYHVNPTGTIQEAVDAANPGDKILVHNGTYDEQLVINKNLTVQGIGSSATLAPSSATRLITVLDAPWLTSYKKIAAIVVANATGNGQVVVKNLNVDGTNVTSVPAGADFVVGILYLETGGTIDTVSVNHIMQEDSTYGDGIYVATKTTTVTVEIENSTVASFRGNGIETSAEGVSNRLTVYVQNNTVNGRGPIGAGEPAQNGILVTGNSLGTVENNTISHFAYTSQSGSASGIMFLDANGAAAGNVITDSQEGAVAAADTPGSWTVAFENNEISGSSMSAIHAQVTNADASITLVLQNNDLTGGSGDGINIGLSPSQSPAGNITLVASTNLITGWNCDIRLKSSIGENSTIGGNVIEDAADSGIRAEQSINASNVVVTYNIIAQNSNFGVFNNGSGILDARNNWWGDATGPYHQQLNPSGRGNNVSDFVNFQPWLEEQPGQPIVKIEPSLTIIAPGETCSITVNTLNATDVTGWEFKLFYRNDIVNCTGVSEGPFLSGEGGTFFLAQIDNTYNSTHGYVLVACSLLGQNVSVSGSGTMATLTFEALTKDETTLDLVDTKLSDTRIPPQPIPHASVNGAIQVSTIMKVDPPTSSFIVGQGFSTGVTINGVANLTGWEFKLFYRSDILNCTDVEEGPFLRTGSSTFFTVQISNNYNSTHGRVLVACSLLGLDVSVNGSGTIAVLSFKALGTGNTTLDLIDTKMSDEEEPPQPIDHVALPGMVYVGSQHDVAVVNLTTSKAGCKPIPTVGSGFTTEIVVTVENNGAYLETFNVTLYANSTPIGTLTETNLAPLAQGTLTYAWNTSGFALGNYTISAYAWPVPNETNTANNNLTDGTVEVTIPGDVNGDGIVNILDAITLANSFFATPASSNWNPNADINGDGVVNILDAIILANHFLQHYP